MGRFVLKWSSDKVTKKAIDYTIFSLSLKHGDGDA